MVVGLDLSLTDTGIVAGYPGSLSLLGGPYEPEVQQCIGRANNNKVMRRFDLLDRIEMARVAVESVVVDAREGGMQPVVFLEGYAMGVRGSRVFDLGELGGIVKKSLYDAGVMFYIVAPTQLKKFIIGKGVGGKSDMRMATFKRYGVDFADDNICDAFGLAVLGCAFLGLFPEENLVQPQREVIHTLMKEQSYA